MSMIALFMFMLHAFHDLFILNLIPENLQQIEGSRSLTGSENILNPCIRSTAYIDKKITLLYLCHILNCRLIAVQIRTIIQEQGQFHMVRILPENILYPVIFRKDRCNYL